VVRTESLRLVIRDPNTNMSFLIDSGSDVSLIPKMSHNSSKLSSFTLYAANNSPIKTFGTKNLTITLGLRRSFKWSFIVAQVDHAIIGADFLHHFKLLVDLGHNRIIDSVTHLSTSGKLATISTSSINTLHTNCKYFDLLKQFPSITKLTNTSDIQTTKHNTTHITLTKGQPISSKARRLPVDKLTNKNFK